jgi:deazaflavin-dependent oxidoreductase (nitroreductase family)
MTGSSALRRFCQVGVCALVLAGGTALWAEGKTGDEQAVNLRDSPAKATTPRNAEVVEQFRARATKPGGVSADSGLLLLHTTGARTGEPRLTPLAYLRDEDRLVVIASYGGAPKDPAWYHNLVANPKVGVEVGAEQFHARATVVPEPERSRLFAKMAAKSPAFTTYQQKASPRVIPVVALTRVP